MEDPGRSGGVKVSGRGELHLAILIEEMRREGLESEFLTDTRGMGIMASRFTGYGSRRGEIAARELGASSTPPAA